MPPSPLAHRFASFALVAVVSLAAREASAQSNYRATPTGGRSALMGNTGIVFARDGSAPFLNPATLVWIRDQRVAFSVNFYSVSVHVLNDYHDPNGTARGRFGDGSSATYVQPRVDAIPSTFCFFTTLKEDQSVRLPLNPEDATTPTRVNQKLAFCFGTAERRLLSATAERFVAGARDLRTTRVSTLSDRYDRVLIGPSYSISIGERLSLGASLHLVRTDPAYSFNAHTVSAPFGGQTSYGISTAAESYDVALLAGATWSADRATTLGLSIQPPTVHIAGKTRATLQRFTAEGSENESEIAAGDGTFKAPLPMRVGLGLGVAVSRLRVELNTTVHFPQRNAFESTMTTTRQSAANGLSLAEDELRERTVERSNLVLDSAVGVEYSITKSISLLGGLATAWDAAPPISNVSFGQIRTSRDNRQQVTFGFGTYAGGSELFVGLQLARGFGQAMAIDSYAKPNDAVFVRAESYSGTFIIAGSTSVQALKQTVDEIRKPKPVPKAPPGAVREPPTPDQPETSPLDLPRKRQPTQP